MLVHASKLGVLRPIGNAYSYLAASPSGEHEPVEIGLDVAIAVERSAQLEWLGTEIRLIWRAMDIKILATVFAAIFIAELGDKTQLATFLFAADREVSKLTVFVGASLALVVTSGVGVIAGGLIAQYVGPRVLSYVAGVGFIGIGIWTLATA